MSNTAIAFSKPYLDDRVIPYLREVLASGKLSGDGPMGKRVETFLHERFNLPHALLTTSGTHALEMAMMLLDLRPGDEVITPSFTFVSTANAILRGGGVPVFCDIDSATLTLDPRDLEARITPRTRAVIPVHYAGVAAPMDEILAIARRHKLLVIEDAAQGVAATYKGRYLGSIGDMGAYSFHDTKNIVSGEGGAFLTNSHELARRAEIVREKGTNRANFLRGEVDKYTWVDQGSSYILSDLLAAVLMSQLDMLEEIQQKRKSVYERYAQGLGDLERAGRLCLPTVPPHCTTNYHMFYILLRSGEERNTVMHRLKQVGIQATFHYIPLHSAPYGTRLPSAQYPLPVTDRIAGSLLRLPLHPGLSLEDADRVVAELRIVLRD